MASRKCLPSTYLAFLDLETTVPSGSRETCDILEVGVLLLDAETLKETESFSTLVRSSRVTRESTSINGLTQDQVNEAPEFQEIAAELYGVLDQQTWIGHNLKAFDAVHLRRAYESAGLRCPEPALLIDTYEIFRKGWRRRTPDLKLATLADHFGLERPSHRALSDCRANLAILMRRALLDFLIGRYGKSRLPLAREKRRLIRERVSHAMEAGRLLSFRYRGGRRPNTVRSVRPIRWLDERKGRVFRAYCIDSAIEKTYVIARITEIEER